MKLLSKVSGIFDRTLGLLAFLGAAVIIFMTAVVCWDVASRFFLGHGLGWTLEVVEYGLLWFTLLATAWVLKKERHVRIDIMVNRLKPRFQNLFNIFGSIIGAVVSFVLAWYGAQVTLTSFHKGILEENLRIPEWTVQVIIPVGGLLLFIQFLRMTYGYLRGSRAL